MWPWPDGERQGLDVDLQTQVVISPEQAGLVDFRCRYRPDGVFQGA